MNQNRPPGIAGCAVAALWLAGCWLAPALATCPTSGPEARPALAEDLRALAHLPGVWVGDEMLSRGDGTGFVLMTEFEPVLGGTALSFTNYYLFEDGCETQHLARPLTEDLELVVDRTALRMA